MSDQTFDIPPGAVVVTTYGSITMETTQSLLDIQAYNLNQGLNNISYRMFPGSLVDKARNDACRFMLEHNLLWVLFIDGDMVPPADAVRRMLQTAFGVAPHFDVVGGYCNLRGEAAIPTIDTGTGTWESHFPGSGLKEVIRTGGAFLLVKRHVCERIPAPWFALRVPMRPVDAMAEVDNYARIKFDGTNPFRSLPEWDVLERIASRDPSTRPGAFVPIEVGEDSGFCDRVRMAGMRIAVDTDIEILHVHRSSIGAARHKDAMAERQRDTLLLCGVEE